MQSFTKHVAPLDERCTDCGRFLLRTFDRADRDLCPGHVDPFA